MEEMILLQADALPAFSHRGYSMNLLQYGTVHGILSEARQTELRDALQTAAAERAAAYTGGRSTTVTRQQAEMFFSSVFCQLDAALLALQSDVLALEALRSRPIGELMEAGFYRILTLYDEAKADFRRAYELTKSVQTSFFRELLKGFARFTTEYDARFRAKDAQQYVDFCYPLLCDRRLDEEGLFAVHSYYAALKQEGEFLSRFDAEEVRTLMQRYAARFRTDAEMIAENIAELVFRHWIAGVLTGADGGLLLPEDTADAVTAQFSGRPQFDLERAVGQAVQTHPLMQGNSEMQAYLLEAVPQFSAAMYAHISDGNLSGWFA